MKIVAVEVYQKTLPLARPYRLSGGRLLFEALDSTFVRVVSDAGPEGWGEACPWGASYLPAFGAGVRAAMSELAPCVIGLDPRRIEVIERAMDMALPGHLYAKSAIDMACWDTLGRAVGLPLVELLGGRVEGDVMLQSSVSTADPQGMVELVREWAEQGYRIHSCKVGGPDVDADIERIRHLSELLPEGHSLTFDANRSWLPDTAIQIMNAAADLDGYFEQPCETLDECLRVRGRTRQPIILDECIQTFSDLLAAWRGQACEAVGLKLGRVGGLTKARRMRDFCVQAGIRMNVEETGGSVLADTAAVHLAQATALSHRRATWLCHEMLSEDVAPGQGARNEGGVAIAPSAAGLGVVPDLDRLGDPVAVYRSAA